MTTPRPRECATYGKVTFQLGVLKEGRTLRASYTVQDYLTPLSNTDHLNLYPQTLSIVSNSIVLHALEVPEMYGKFGGKQAL